MELKNWVKLSLLTIFISFTPSFFNKLTAAEKNNIPLTQIKHINFNINKTFPVTPHIAQASKQTITVTDIGGFTSVISSLALTPDGKTLLVATGDGTINVLDLSNAQVIYTKTFVAETRDVVATSDNNSFAVALGNELAIFSLNEPQIIKRWPAHVEKITQIAISPDNKYLASMSVAERTTKIWDLTTGELIKTLGEGQGVASTLLFNPNGQFLVTAASGTDRTLKFWNVQTWELLTTSPQQPGNIYDIAMTTDGTKLVAAIRNMVKVWDLTNGVEIFSWKAADLDLNAVAIAPDARIVATADKEEKIKLWDLSNGKLLATLTGHKGWVLSLVFSPDGNYLYSGAEDKIVKIWDISPLINK